MEFGFEAVFELGDDASAVGAEVIVNSSDGLADLGFGAEGEEVLAVHFTPEGDSAFEFFSEVLDGHAEELGVDGVDADFDEVLVDIDDVAVGVHEDVFSGVVGHFSILGVTGFKEFPPLLRADQQGPLRPPIIHESNGVYGGLEPGFEVGQVEFMDDIPEFVKFGRFFPQVHIQIFGAADVLHPFEDSDGGTEGKAAGGIAEFVDFFHPGADPGIRGFDFIEVGPIFDEGVLDFADDSRLEIMELAVPFVDADSGLGSFALHVGQSRRADGRTGEITFKLAAEFFKVFFLMYPGSREGPEVARDAVGFLKVQGSQDTFF